MSELRNLGIIAIVTSIIVGLTALFVFHIPPIFSGIITIITAVVFLFIALWSSYLFFK